MILGFLFFIQTFLKHCKALSTEKYRCYINILLLLLLYYYYYYYYYCYYYYYYYKRTVNQEFLFYQDLTCSFSGI